LVSDVVEFSERDTSTKGYFANCGLYAVGSSITQSDYKDIDITLVGLDFNMVFEFDKVYLGDREELIKSGMVVPFDGSCNDTNEIEFRSGGIDYVNDRGNSWCLSERKKGHIKLNKLPRELFGFLSRKKGTVFDDLDLSANNLNPLRPYTDPGNFIGSECHFGPIHMFIHGENLFVNPWKSHQLDSGLDYVELHEWEKADCVDPFQRLRPFSVGYPNFIDIMGENRAEIDKM
jgi:hypothetical protein